VSNQFWRALSGFAVMVIGVATLMQPVAAQTPTPATPWIVAGRRYYFPVQPPGLAKYGNRHHDYPATDIFVPVGSTVVAVTDGVVDEVSLVDRWDPKTNLGAERGGLWVTIIGDDGIRYHTSHLSAVEAGIVVGVHVTAGQIIARSGKTGNARSTPAHVHFGISCPTVAGDWAVRRGIRLPYRYLKAWTRGEDVTPIINRKDKLAKPCFANQ
jgi:peptidoglycan LD-endopeptidase LytH